MDINQCWGVDHDKIILLSTAFPTIPMLGTDCCCNVILVYVGNKSCIVLCLLDLPVHQRQQQQRHERSDIQRRGDRHHDDTRTGEVSAK